MPKNILVGYDGSETARRAYLFALELAACSKAKVHVVSVMQMDNGADTSALMMTDIMEERLGGLREEIAALGQPPACPWRSNWYTAAPATPCSPSWPGTAWTTSS